MADIILVDDLVQNVREGIDESNIVDITDEFILKKLNKAQRRATNVIVPRYDELFLAETGSTARPDTTTTEGTVSYALPSDIYGTRLENIILVKSDSSWYDLSRLRKQETAAWKSTSNTNEPSRYCIVHRNFEVYPPPTAGLTLRLLYTRIPETLVLQQGCISSTGTDSVTNEPYVVVDDIGSALSEEVTGNNCFVNIIDPRTGNVRGSLQISSIDSTNNKILFKASGLTKSSVLGKTISTSLPASIAVDDYVCTVHGTCVPEVPEAYSDYLTQHTVVAIKRIKGESTTEDFAELKDQEASLSSAWAGLEQKRRVRLKSARYRTRS